MKKKLVALAEYMVNENCGHYVFVVKSDFNKPVDFSCEELRLNTTYLDIEDNDPTIKSFFALILSEAYTTLK